MMQGKLKKEKKINLKTQQNNNFTGLKAIFIFSIFIKIKKELFSCRGKSRKSLMFEEMLRKKVLRLIGKC